MAGTECAECARLDRARAKAYRALYETDRAWEEADRARDAHRATHREAK